MAAEASLRERADTSCLTIIRWRSVNATAASERNQSDRSPVNGSDQVVDPGFLFGTDANRVRRCSGRDFNRVEAGGRPC